MHASSGLLVQLRRHLAVTHHPRSGSSLAGESPVIMLFFRRQLVSECRTSETDVCDAFRAQFLLPPPMHTHSHTLAHVHSPASCAVWFNTGDCWMYDAEQCTAGRLYGVPGNTSLINLFDLFVQYARYLISYDDTLLYRLSPESDHAATRDAPSLPSPLPSPPLTHDTPHSNTYNNGGMYACLTCHCPYLPGHLPPPALSSFLSNHCQRARTSCHRMPSLLRLARTQSFHRPASVCANRRFRTVKSLFLYDLREGLDRITMHYRESMVAALDNKRAVLMVMFGFAAASVVLSLGQRKARGRGMGQGRGQPVGHRVHDWAM